MAHDVFICHSSEDKTLANAACAKLEAAGIRCWIAPRDPLPGIPYGRQLVSAIETSGIILLIFSGHANRSEHILRELELASDRGKIVVPYRIEDIKPTGDLEYYIRNVHWLDAMSGPVEARLDDLVVLVRKVLETLPGHTLGPAATPATVAVEAAVAATPNPEPAIPGSSKMGILVGAAGLVVALAAGAFAFVTMNSHKEAAAPVVPPATAAATVAAQAMAKPAIAAPPAAAAVPVAAPTARIVYVEKPAAPVPTAPIKPAAPVAKPATHEAAATHAPAAAAAVAVATAAVAAPAAAEAPGFDTDLRSLLNAASNHFADAKGKPRTLRGQQQYAYTPGVSGTTGCFIHQSTAGILTSTSCRIYLGMDPDFAQTAYKKYAALLSSFATSAGGTATERPRPANDGFVTAYSSNEGRLRIIFVPADKTANGQATVFLWGDAPL